MNIDKVHVYVNLAIMRKINFYRTDDDKCPIEEFLDSLNSKQVQKVAWVLQLVEELEVVPTTYLKKLVSTDDIWEIRVQVGGNIFRLFGFFDHDNLVILNHGFQKKTQKTPPKEIKIAESRKKNYLQRKPL
ncbi:type II toxin-antitoxin system RelE/ParE family toxin [Marinomonas sp. RSW2]|uniref:Type II toxin-antitoxin system RelE/ParE family toxin n=1 Tax=Marinomonas maritima TaxID=2940935 RepID=A0ABT5WAC0_9GAMM|nr:type II toxin-antitoxin system RelE/ParE family toxin [Marinomonas maritima]MDE8601758.1 type II toxin-antitoxin system RelE/ParE family toxin [Marinomonas maritima]